jgi:hypothetical protein
LLVLAWLSDRVPDVRVLAHRVYLLQPKPTSSLTAQLSRPFLTCCALNGIRSVRDKAPTTRHRTFPDPSTKLPVNSTRFHSCLRGGDRPRLDLRDLLGSGDALYPHFYHRRVHSFDGWRDTPLLAQTHDETPAWRTSFGRCWFQGFHEASPRHTLPCTLVGVLVDEVTWSGLLARILVGAEPSITGLVEVGTPLRIHNPKRRSRSASDQCRGHRAAEALALPLCTCQLPGSKAKDGRTRVDPNSELRYYCANVLACSNC